MMNRCLESAGKQSSLFQWASGRRRPSNGMVSPVQAVTVTHAGLAMVTSLSWMVNARMSSVIGSGKD